MKDLGAKVFSYGWACPALMINTYNEDNTVNVMCLHECTRTNAGYLSLCIGVGKKTHANIVSRHAFTITIANKKLMKEIDFFGSVSGYDNPDKFSKTGLHAKKSKFVDAPIIEESPVVIECELIKCIKAANFTTVLARVVNIAADESVIDSKTGGIDSSKIGMLFYDSFTNSYYTLGERVGTPWEEGTCFM